MNGNLFVQGTGVIDGDVTVNDEGSAIVRNGGKINWYCCCNER
jgi:hypothetical protein